MTTCQLCSGASTLFLCQPCVTELRGDLTALATGPVVNGHPTAGLLDALNDVVTRQTKVGGSGGHRKRGDEMPDPFEPHAADSRPNAVKLTPQGRASALLHSTRNSLTTIMRDLCETRNVSPLRAFQVIPGEFIGPLMPGWRRVPLNWQPSLPEIAQWLAKHVHALACDADNAGQWKREIDALRRRIERAIDRPPSPKFCGQCDTMIDRKMCGINLFARREAIEVTCPNCRVTHNVEKLFDRTIISAAHKTFTREALVGNQRCSDLTMRTTGIMGAIGEFVHWQTFNRWLRDRHLKPAMYQRPNGRRGFHRHGDEDIPEYRLADVRRVARQMDEQRIAKRKVAG